MTRIRKFMFLKEKHRARQERSKAAFSAIDAVRQKISADRRLRF